MKRNHHPLARWRQATDLMWRQLLLPLAMTLSIGMLGGQGADTSQAADSLSRPDFSWTGRMVPFLQDAPKPYRLRLPWDEWAHSDLVATAANPFIPADLRIGALMLDGSLGQPVFSALNPSAVMELPHGSRLSLVSAGPGETLGRTGEIPTFAVAPMQELSRSNQTYFFWDQGDYLLRDVQAGGVVRLGGNRSLVMAGQSRSHPGPYSLAGPSRTQIEGSVLQNYLLDYQRAISPRIAFNYTLLRQDEQVGLPWFDNGALTADRRRTRTWAHGFQAEAVLNAWTVRLNAAAMISDLQTTTDGVQPGHMSRRSLSLWAGGDASYQWSRRSRFLGEWGIKRRHIADQHLDPGYRFLGLAHGRLGFRRAGRRVSGYGGIALVDGRLKPEAWISAGSTRQHLSLSTAATSFLDYPHLARRITLDSTTWLPGPLSLRRTALAGRMDRPWGHVSVRLSRLTTGDGRSADTGGLALDWTPWPDLLRVRGSITAVNSGDSLLMPVRVNGLVAVTFTLPLRRSRARPFAAASATLISNDLAWWSDPRFADVTPYDNPTGSTTTTVLWVNAEVGLKVVNFELRMRWYNPFGITIQNSPMYLPQPSFGPRGYRHYSLTWQFLPRPGASR